VTGGEVTRQPAPVFLSSKSEILTRMTATPRETGPVNANVAVGMLAIPAIGLLIPYFIDNIDRFGHGFSAPA
jgi:hypothetical protein